MMNHWKILITDGLDPSGQALLRSTAQVDDRSGIHAEELIREVPAYHALIVRSRTRVKQEVFEAARSLIVVGRAGVGVDNIDCQTALGSLFHEPVLVGYGVGFSRAE